MARFEVNMATVVKAEGGFQNDPTDKANYCTDSAGNKILIGTKYGVSAIGFQGFFGRCPTEEEMRNLTIETAGQIGKAKYWNPVNGDRIKNQSVADMMFSYVWGSGSSQISNLKAVANAVNGKRVIVENDNHITDGEADIINSLNQEKYWLALREFRINFFHKIVADNPNLGKYLQGWLNRMAKRTFVSDEKKK